MFKITRIHVKNFRSIKECTFELKALQLLIGPNNSGKSNLLRVFEFLKFANNSDTIKDIDISRIRFQHKTSQSQTQQITTFPDPIEITVELYDKESNKWGYYKIELYHVYQSSHPGVNNAVFNIFVGIRDSSLNKNDFIKLNLDNLDIINKQFSLSAVARNSTKGITEEENFGQIQNANSFAGSRSYELKMTPGKIEVAGTNIMLGVFLLSHGNDPLFSLKNSLTNIFEQFIIYKPDTYYIKIPVTQFSKQENIDGQGSNIVAYLEELLSSDPERFQQINKELNSCIPDFKGYNFATIESQSEKGGKVRALRLKDRFGIDHFAEDISEGTLYFLILFAIINQKNLPPVLMLEEPETGIHPRRISEIMEYLFKLGEQYPNLSIILTTHHPYVVDHFSDLKDRVWVFDSEDGESKIRNLERDIIEPQNKQLIAEDEEPIDYSSSLGEHWAMGFLGGVPKPIAH